MARQFHRNCHVNTMEGVFGATLPGLVRELPAYCVNALYYAENWKGPYDYKPDFWIDISEVYDQWMDALREHALFRGEAASFDYLQYYDGLTAMRGAEVGFKRAQTFALPPISRKRGLPFFPVTRLCSFSEQTTVGHSQVSPWRSGRFREHASQLALPNDCLSAQTIGLAATSEHPATNFF